MYRQNLGLSFEHGEDGERMQVGRPPTLLRVVGLCSTPQHMVQELGLSMARVPAFLVYACRWCLRSSTPGSTSDGSPSRCRCWRGMSTGCQPASRPWRPCRGCSQSSTPAPSSLGSLCSACGGSSRQLCRRRSSSSKQRRCEPAGIDSTGGLHGNPACSSSMGYSGHCSRKKMQTIEHGEHRMVGLGL